MKKRKRLRTYEVWYEPDPMQDSIEVKAFSTRGAKKIAMEQEDLDEYQIESVNLKRTRRR